MKTLNSILLAIAVLCCQWAQAQCPTPTVDDFSPKTGFIGSLVTIHGTNFDASPANNQVFFGATEANIISATSSTLEVIVPVGATYAPISVKNGCGEVAQSILPFNGIFCNTLIDEQSYAAVTYSRSVNGGYHMVSQDIDNDGKPEMIVVGFTSKTLGVLRNLSTPGNFNFADPVNLTTPSYTRCVTAGDFDGDGKVDLAVSVTSNGVYVYKNTSTPGNISFDAPVILNQATTNPYQIYAGDINGDGKLDLTYSAFNDQLFVQLNTSTGGTVSFGDAHIHSVGHYTTGVVVADLNNDGRVDIGTSHPQHNLIKVVVNNTPVGADTVILAPAEQYETQRYPYRIFTADFNKDGKMDLVTNCHAEPAVNVFENISTNDTVKLAPRLEMPGLNGTYRISIGDADGDGYPDIVTKYSGAPFFSIFRNLSAGGSTSFATRVDYPGQQEVSGIVIGDMDGDYVPDISTSGITNNSLRIHSNTSAVVDTTAPQANCKDGVLYIDAKGQVAFNVDAVNGGISDECGLAGIDYTIEKEIFNCDDVGKSYSVSIMATDNSGNQDSCTATVTIADTTSPIAIAQDITIYLDANGTASIQIGDIDNGSRDNCLLDSAAISQSAFDCSHIGPNNVDLTVWDASGNSAQATAVVTVMDTLAPELVCQNAIIALDSNGNATLTAADVIATLSDNCGLNDTTLSQVSFDISHMGDNQVTITVSDVNGNTSECVATVTVVEPAPVAICKDATLYLDSNGVAQLTIDDIDDGSHSMVGLSSRVITQTDFDCSHLGANTVQLIVTNTFNNSDTCEAMVMVYDEIAPVITCPADISVTATPDDCDPAVTWGAIQVDEACLDQVTSSHNSGDEFPVGTTTVTVIAVDKAGNSDTCRFDVTVNAQPMVVVSITSPEFIGGHNVSCKGNNDGEATVVVDGGCEPYSYSWSPAGGNASTATGLTAGAYSVTITDANGTSINASITLTEPSDIGFAISDNQRVYYGYNPMACADLEVSAIAGGVPAYSTEWSNGESGEMINVCPTQDEIFTATVTDANGCTHSEQVKVCVTDVRYEYYGCYYPGYVKMCYTYWAGCYYGWISYNYYIHEYYVDYYLSQYGWTLGECGTNPDCEMDDMPPAAPIIVPGIHTTSPIEANNAVNPVKVFPNPATEVAQVEFRPESNERAVIEVYNMLGEKVTEVFNGVPETQFPYLFPLEVNQWKKGLYIIQVKQGTQRFSKTFSVQ